MLVENRAVVAAIPQLGLEPPLARRGDPPLVDQGAVGGTALAGVGRRLAGDAGGRLHLLAVFGADLLLAAAACALDARAFRPRHRLRERIATIIRPLPAGAFTDPDGREVALAAVRRLPRPAVDGGAAIARHPTVRRRPGD